MDVENCCYKFQKTQFIECKNIERKQLGYDEILDRDFDACTDCKFKAEKIDPNLKIVAEFAAGKTNPIKHIFTTAANIVNDITFFFGFDGIRILNLSASMVISCRFFFAKEDLVSYEINQYHAISVSALDFSKILGKSKGYDRLKIVAKERELIVLFDRKEKQLSKKFTLKGIDHPDMIIEKKIAKLVKEFVPNIMLSASNMIETITDFDCIGDTVNIKLRESGIIFNGEGNSASGNIFMKKGMLDLFDYTEDVNNTYAINLLYLTKDLVKVFKLVRLSLYPEVPIIFTFDLDELSYIQLIIAPRVEQDEYYD